MKEPWQIFYDELRREWKRDTAPTGEGFTRSIKIAADATGHHLVHRLHWDEDKAMDLLHVLASAIRPDGKGETPRERLRHAYTDWVLSRRGTPPGSSTNHL